MKKQCLGSILLLILALCIFAYQPQAEWSDRSGTDQVVHLTDLIKNPHTWFDIPVRIPLRFCRIGNSYTPYYTQFSEDQYVNFSAWDVQTPIWDKEGFASDYPHFYMEKDNPELKTFLKLQSLETITVIAKMASVFRQKPYFRVVWVCKVPGQLDVDSLKSIYKGMKSLQARKFDDAIANFQKVIPDENPPIQLPHDIDALLHKTIAKVYLYEKKDAQKALEELEKALDVSPNNREAHELYAKCTYYLEHGGTPPAPLYWEEEGEKKAAKPEVKTETKPDTKVPSEIPQISSTPTVE